MQKKRIAFLLTLLTVFGLSGYFYVNAYPEKFGGTVTFVSGTEYASGDTAQTIVRVTNALGIGLTADWCNVTIVYPNRTTNVTENTAMTANGIDGSWNYGWTAPSEYGIYEQYAECKVSNRIIANSKASHVSETLSLINETDNPVAIVIS